MPSEIFKQGETSDFYKFEVPQIHINQQKMISNNKPLGFQEMFFPVVYIPVLY